MEEGEGRPPARASLQPDPGDDRLGRLGSYAQLKRAANLIDPAIARFAQDMEEKLTDISGDLLFFGLEINRLSDDVLAAQLKAPAAAHYASWLRDVRMYRPHQLSVDQEGNLYVTGYDGPWLNKYTPKAGADPARLVGQPLVISE